MTGTALDIIRRGYRHLGVLGPGDPVSPELGSEGLDTLNLMMNSLKLPVLSKPVQARMVFPIVAGKGSTTNPYTVGPGGDLSITRPNAKDIQGAGLLLLSNPSQPTEIERAVYTDQTYQRIPIKDLPNSMFTGVYYNATYVGGFGTLFLNPVPNGSLASSLVLYLLQPLSPFVSLTATYDMPDGLEEMLGYNFALRSAASNSKLCPPDIASLAIGTLGAFKRANTTVSDLSNDAGRLFGGVARGGYNINSGTGG